MKEKELIDVMIQYGTEKKVFNDIFCGNIELYRKCFLEFLNEPNFELLQKSVSSKQYQQAFEAAHALKGLSGNLGLTPLYQSICILVEELRSGQYSEVDSKYARIVSQLCILKNLCDNNSELFMNAMAGGKTQ